MLELWTGIALLTLLAMAFVCLPILRVKQQEIANSSINERIDQNVLIFRERLSELEQEKQAGTLEQADFEVLKIELERNLLSDASEHQSTTINSTGKLCIKSLLQIGVIAVIIPIASLSLYLATGRSADLELAYKQSLATDDITLEQATEQLEQVLQEKENNPEGWYLLATTYLNQGRYQEGVESLKKVLEQVPETNPQYPHIMGQLAQAQFFAQGSRYTETVRGLINKTLELDPYETTVRGLLGIEAFELGQYEEAIEQWHKALKKAKGKEAESLRIGIEEAQKKLRQQGKDIPDRMEQSTEFAIHLRVQLANSLLTKAKPDDKLFVFASIQGSKMPLAAVRLKVSDLPKDVILDKTTLIQPNQSLTTLSEVSVSARISLSGKPEAVKGDLYGTIPSLKLDRKMALLPILVIDRVVE